MSPFDMMFGDDDPLSMFSLMFLKRSITAKLGDLMERFTLKMKKVSHEGAPSLWVVIERKGEADRPLRVVSKSLAQNVSETADALTGDPGFDERFSLAGANELESAVFLGSETRKRLLETLDEAAGLDVEPGLATILFQGGAIIKSGKLAERIAGVAMIMDELAAGMGDDAANRKKIIRNLRSEESPEAKLRMLKALISFYSVDDETAALLENLLEDENPEVRIEAAAKLGEQGRAALMQMFEGLPVRKSGLAALVIGKLAESDAQLQGNFVKKLVMKSHNPDVRVRVEELIRHQGDYHPPKIFMELFEKSGDREIRRALFSAIVAGVKRSGETPDDFFTGCLVDVDRQVRLGAIRELGAAGGPSCVEALCRCAESFGSDTTGAPILVRISLVRRDRAERDEARTALEKIRSRLGSAGEGWLSVTRPADAEGALSRTDGAGEGALSEGESHIDAEKK
ncbi:MAG TPA: hypothetical protein PKY31_03430 [Spirochaetota bacterium]|nr:hypothetical protein [Spirochaetota bacterium]